MENCLYCTSISDSDRIKDNIALGFCGTCEECNEPGHIQHFPGPVPYTGAWCDKCVIIVEKRHKTQSKIIIALLIISGLILITII